MRKIVPIIFLLMLSIILTVPVSATTISNPDSISITSAKFVRNVIDDGDMAVVYEFGINYDDDDYPTTVWASQSFELVFYDTDGETEIDSDNPFVYIDYGYQSNFGGFYFTASAAEDLTWEAAYNIGIVPVDEYFASPPDDYQYTLTTSDYSTVTSQSDNKTLITNYIREICQNLQAEYEGLSLLVSTEDGTKLSADGENWVRGAIPGAASIASDLFYVQYYVPTTSDFSYNNDQQEIYSNRASSWDITSGLDAIATHTGLDSAATVATFGFVAIALIFTILCAYRGLGIEPGLFGSMMIMECGGLLFGSTIFTIVLTVSLLCGIFIFFVWYLRRA